jgi:hypothetical protein
MQLTCVSYKFATPKAGSFTLKHTARESSIIYGCDGVGILNCGEFFEGLGEPLAAALAFAEVGLGPGELGEPNDDAEDAVVEQ